MRLLPRWWQEHFLPTEFVAAAVLGIAFWVWGDWYSGSDTLSVILSGNRGAIYGALASVFGSLLGFAITAVSIVIGFTSHVRLELIRKSRHYPTVWRVFFAAIRSLGLATVVALAGLVLDRDNAPRFAIFYFMVFTSALAILRVARCAWVLEKVIELIASGPDGEKP